MQVWVRFLSGGRRGETVPLSIPEGGAASIGRADDNTIMLPPAVDVAASSRHCELRPYQGVLWLMDQGSTNGTWINGQRVTQVQLPSGSRVTFGRGGPEAEIFSQADAAPAAPAQPAQPAVPKDGDPCGICARPLAPGSWWMCPVCRKGMCSAVHYDAAAQRCMVCSGAQAAPSFSQATRAATPIPEQPLTNPHQQAAITDGCEICGALSQPSFVCFNCMRCVCETHRSRSTGTCDQCAR